jgi:hypothetical protein
MAFKSKTIFKKSHHHIHIHQSQERNKYSLCKGGLSNPSHQPITPILVTKGRGIGKSKALPNFMGRGTIT